MNGRGVLLTFEGGEGSGKSTQIRSLARDLEAAGCAVRVLREPGGTAAGEAVRKILLDPDHAGLDARAELLLYEAARAQLVSEVIEPALAAGEIVLCDRFFDSTTAYQGYGRDLPLSEVEALNAIATGGLVPDRTIFLDLAPMVGINRYEGEKKGIPQQQMSFFSDRMERQDLAFHERVREGFLAIARSHPERVRVLDASGSVDEVADAVRAALRDVPALRAALGETG